MTLPFGGFVLGMSSLEVLMEVLLEMLSEVSLAMSSLEVSLLEVSSLGMSRQFNYAPRVHHTGR